LSVAEPLNFSGPLDNGLGFGANLLRRFLHKDLDYLSSNILDDEGGKRQSGNVTQRTLMMRRD
jgi:hypothetical protein